MRIKLKGINRVSKKLADGKRVTYYYAWKGGPRLEGEPGTTEFISSYNAAVASLKRLPTGSLQFVIDDFERSSEFTRLAPRTQSDYKKFLKLIRNEFGDMPIKLLADPRTRGQLLAWRDRLAAKSRRQGDYAFSVLARTISWAFDRGLVPANPCERPGRLYRSTRRESIWEDADEAAFLAVAPDHMQLAFQLAVWTGQRQGDLIKLPWSAYDGSHIRLKQGKTGKRVVVRVAGPLKAILDSTPKRAVTILTTATGSSWTGNTFGTAWRRLCRKAQVSGLTFHDLRGTAVTRLAHAGATEAEIASVTGHSSREVGAILDAHYLKHDSALGDSAIHKLETRTNLPTALPTGDGSHEG